MKELMQGAHSAKHYITTYLQDDIPIIKYRNGWGVDDGILPSPAEYLTYEPLALDAWPSIITVAINAKSFTRLEYDGSTLDPLYRVAYGMRTYIWVKTEGSYESTLMRDRLTTVIRSALLDYPCLSRVDSAREARVEETSMSEEYSDLTLLKGDRVLAGAFIGYDLLLDEVITREDIGTVTEYDLEVIGSGDLSRDDLLEEIL
ncbi:MAG: hypothetical protein EB103_02565 [Actinobacteria bacterium]|nr:hypothetical protein [Actinomycetota bacterium]